MASDTPPRSPLARALGRIPQGLFLATTRGGNGPLGFVASLVQQVGFEPPTIIVAVHKTRGPLAALRASGRFALSVLDKQSSAVMGGFFRPQAEGASPFDGHELLEVEGGPVFASALAWLDCKLCGEFQVPDHTICIGEVLAGDLRREGDPSIHLRQNGLSY